MDSKGRFNQEFVTSSHAPIRSLITLGEGPSAKGGGLRGAASERKGRGMGGRMRDAVVVGDDDGFVRMYHFTYSSGGMCEGKMAWQVRVGGEGSISNSNSKSTTTYTPGEPITALLNVPQLDQLVVASAEGGVSVLDPSTGQRLASITVSFFLFLGLFRSFFSPRFQSLSSSFSNSFVHSASRSASFNM